jgi:hypothetical protein
MRSRDVSIAAAAAARIRKADEHAANVLPVIRELRAQGITGMRRLAAVLNERRVPTRQGGQWHTSTVRNLLKRDAT